MQITDTATLYKLALEIPDPRHLNPGSHYCCEKNCTALATWRPVVLLPTLWEAVVVAAGFCGVHMQAVTMEAFIRGVPEFKKALDRLFKNRMVPVPVSYLDDKIARLRFRPFEHRPACGCP